MKSQASNNALHRITKSGKRDGLKNKIERYFKKKTISNIKVLSILFDEPKSTITARISKLMEEGKVYEKSTKRGLTIYSYEHWVSLRPLRADVYNERLFESWVTRGIKKHGERMPYELKEQLLKLIK